MNLPLPWLDTSDALPNVDSAWADDSPAPGLLAAGADLSVARLLDAYSHGIFPGSARASPCCGGRPIPAWCWISIGFGSTDPCEKRCNAFGQIHGAKSASTMGFNA
jgi:leucyl/phenylalanyl-tRNA--protein transferase